MTVLGLSCFYHDSCAALIRDGKVIAAVQEERFNRDKYSADFPIQAVNYCFQEAGITIYDVDAIAFYEKMYLKFERTLLSHVIGWPWTLRNFVDTLPLWLKDRLAVPYVIRDELTYNKDIYHVKHHLSHAASAFLVSPFEEAAIMTVDGVGEYATATFGQGKGNDIRIHREMRYPHSLGLLYSIFTAYLGFRVFSGEGKVMALAEFGQPVYLDKFRKLVDLREDGSFGLNCRYFNFNRGDSMHNRQFMDLFGPARKENEELTQRHFDVAASLQRMTEEIMIKMARHVHKETGLKKLCMAGGVFLNVTANSRIRNETPFDEVFIQPGAGDAGAAVGAAAYVYHTLEGHPREYVMTNCGLGPAFSNRAIEVLLKNKGLRFEKLDEKDLVGKVASKMARENQVGGWFQGRMEFGPRALGQRSIIANPGDPAVKDRLNLIVKRREPFRPFAASVLRENVSDFFEGDLDSPFMLLVAQAKADRLSRIPSVVHVNGSSRIQTVTKPENGLYYDLIEEFYRQSGLPMILNTSFNEDEPIVCSPEEAINCFETTNMDFLAIGNYLVER